LFCQHNYVGLYITATSSTGTATESDGTCMCERLVKRLDTALFRSTAAYWSRVERAEVGVLEIVIRECK